MKNKEKFGKEIIEIACSGHAVSVSKVTGKPIACKNNNCKCCVRHNDVSICCDEERLKEWAESEYIEKPVISKRDRAFFEYLDKQYEYLARDKTGQLYVYRAKPYRGDSFWTNVGRRFCLNDRINVDFPMAKWEDSEPWLIEELKQLDVVDEYE